MAGIEHDLIMGLLAIVGAINIYYFRQSYKTTKALECALKECMERMHPPTP